MIKQIIIITGIIFTMITLDSCKGHLSSSDTLTIHNNSDPDKLNPITLSTNNARRINDLIQGLILYQNTSGDYGLLPYIAKENAKITEITEGEFKGGVKIDFEIRPEATWDNGTPITGHDYVFTIKSIINPKTNCENLKGYYDWLGDIIVDSANPKKFSVYSKIKYFKLEETIGGYVIPEYNYDPNHLMKKFTIRDMNSPEKRTALKTNPDIISFATEFNSEKFQRDPKFIVGAGPYTLDHWTTGQEIVLKRKKTWWGDKFQSERAFWAYPKKIKIKIINDNNTALTALKDGQLDNYCNISAKDFKELEKNSGFTSKYSLEKVGRFSYSYLGMNLRNPKFQDIKVREAIAHAVDRDKINKIISFGESTKTESFAHSSQSFYNKNLNPFQYDLASSNKLLDEAGWKDSDGDGIRDKVLNGKKTKLSIEFKYSKDETAKNMALIIQEELKKIGVDLQIVEKEWTVYMQDLDKHNFEMYMISFTISPTMSDPKQQWHTSSAVAGGSNNVGWGDATSDKLIEQIDSELNIEKRSQLYMQLQQKIHDEIPVIFMFNGRNRIATNKKYDVEKVMISPGVFYNEFKLK